MVLATPLHQTLLNIRERWKINMQTNKMMIRKLLYNLTNLTSFLFYRGWGGTA